MTDAAASAPQSAPSGNSEPSAIADSPKGQEKAESQEAQAVQKKLKKYSVLGKEVEVDLSDEKSLDSLISRGLGSDAKFKEASKLMETIEQRYGKLPDWEKNPFWKVIAEGADPHEVAEALLLAKIEDESLSDEQRDYRDTKRKLKALEDEKEASTKSEREKAKSEAQAKAVSQIDEEMTTALKALGRKPTPRLIARIAETLLADNERQIKPLIDKFGGLDKIPDAAFQAISALPANEAVGRVHKEYLSDIAEYLTALPIEEVKKLLPKQVLDGLRMSEVDAVLSQDPVGSRKPRQAAPAEPQKRNAPKRMTTEEWFREKEKKLG